MFVHHVSSNVSTHWEGPSHSAQHKMGTQPVRPQDMGQKKQAWAGRPAPGPGRGGWVQVTSLTVLPARTLLPPSGPCRQVP